MTREQRRCYNALLRQQRALQRQRIKSSKDWEKLRELSAMIEGFREDDN
jgi:hypothetical protein